MNNQTLIIILIIFFFMMNCKISCNKNIENFSTTGLTDNCKNCFSTFSKAAKCPEYVDAIVNRNYSEQTGVKANNPSENELNKLNNDVYDVFIKNCKNKCTEADGNANYKSEIVQASLDNLHNGKQCNDVYRDVLF